MRVNAETADDKFVDEHTVTLNGLELMGCFEADDEAGEALVYGLCADGKDCFLTKDKDPIQFTIKGEVRFVREDSLPEDRTVCWAVPLEDGGYALHSGQKPEMYWQHPIAQAIQAFLQEQKSENVPTGETMAYLTKILINSFQTDELCLVSMCWRSVSALEDRENDADARPGY